MLDPETCTFWPEEFVTVFFDFVAFATPGAFERASWSLAIGGGGLPDGGGGAPFDGGGGSNQRAEQAGKQQQTAAYEGPAIARRMRGAIPRVSAMKTGVVPTGSITTKSVAKAETRKAISMPRA